MQLQFRAKCRFKETTNADMLVFEFSLGPIVVTCLANIPQEDQPESVAYVLLELVPSKSVWEIRPERK